MMRTGRSQPVAGARSTRNLHGGALRLLPPPSLSRLASAVQLILREAAAASFARTGEPQRLA